MRPCIAQTGPQDHQGVSARGSRRFLGNFRHFETTSRGIERGTRVQEGEGVQGWREEGTEKSVESKTPGRRECVLAGLSGVALG